MCLTPPPPPVWDGTTPCLCLDVHAGILMSNVSWCVWVVRYCIDLWRLMCDLTDPTIQAKLTLGLRTPLPLSPDHFCFHLNVQTSAEFFCTSTLHSCIYVSLCCCPFHVVFGCAAVLSVSWCWVIWYCMYFFSFQGSIVCHREDFQCSKSPWLAYARVSGK